MKRGEVRTISGGPDYAGKPRPGVIIQSDRFSSRHSATVCMFTSDPRKSRRTRVKVERNDRNKLSASSYLMVDKITTLPRRKVGQKIGDLDQADMARLDRAIVKFLGLDYLVAPAG